jgi:shikimate 5-dehydrogenase
VTERMVFIGVSTGGSSIMALFPRWAEMLGLDVELEGCDIPLGAPADVFRAAVERIVTSGDVRGGLVTTHKLAVFRHAGDLFDEFDEYAHICSEVSCISKRAGRVSGYAKDPITAAVAVDEMLGREYWADSTGHVLCLGAGGAGVAITLCLLTREHPPARIVLTDVHRDRLEAALVAHGHVQTETALEYLAADEKESGELLSELPPGSLIINATGMGKDRPGSPLPSHTSWPSEGIAWDLNYRGELEFLAQARAVQRDRSLRIFDGWRYFLYGWTAHISEIFGTEIDSATFAGLAAAAEPFRPARA